MLDLVDFVKVDLLEAGERDIERRLPHLLKSRKSLIAQRVETPEEFEFYKRNGFQYFQGYFFCRPESSTALTIPVNRVSMFRLLSRLHDPETSAREIEKLVAEDLALSYKLLRYINSAYIGLPHKIESIVHAVRLVGMEQVRKIASLILLSAAKSEPKELIRVSLIRGKMCELMAERLRHEKKETFFTVGLFSTLDAFLNCPMKQALELLPFSEEIRSALLDRRGTQGKALELALMYESCCLDELPEQFDARTLQEAYWQAVEWQQDVMLRIA
jgi:EAL and modified HD-GYP domain-containing signal transduction protein